MGLAPKHVITSLLFLGVVAATSLRGEEPDDVATTAAKIDRLIAAAWEARGVTPAPIADDAEFLRRVHLDLAGKIPTVAEVRLFLADRSPTKRRRVVDDLLESSGYIVHFTNVWRNALIPEANGDVQLRFLAPSLEAWLRQKLAENTSYDQLVREILTLPMQTGNDRNAYIRMRAGQATPMAFYQAKQVAAENLASATSRVFLGLRIECAQCHDHPFDEWKRRDFWSFAAFYAGLQRQGNNVFGLAREVEDRRELKIPDSEEVVKASFLGGYEPEWKSDDSSREVLAEWVTSKENAYFARTVANRYWAHFFGRGLVDPVDDFSENNPPSHPELLDELGQEMAAHEFDLKFLIRAITASTAYQRSSRRTHDSQDEPTAFARMPVRALTADQIYRNVLQATGTYQPYQPQQAYVLRGAGNEIQTLFANESEAPTEAQVSILQALAMMNGQVGNLAMSSRTLSAIIDYPGLDNAGKVETLFLATLSRKPTDKELTKYILYVETPAGKTSDASVHFALSDVFWALLNSSEFLFNH
jgi:hypothetical protein